MQDVGYHLILFRNYIKRMGLEFIGLTPGQYFIQLKIEKAKMLLSDPSLSIKKIAYDLQFESGFYFSRLFKEKTGLTPENFRKQFYGFHKPD